MTVAELIQKRNERITFARKEYLDKAEAENRGMSNEEQLKYDTVLKEVGEFKTRIDNQTKSEELERELASSAGRVVTAETNQAKRTLDAKSKWDEKRTKYDEPEHRDLERRNQFEYMQSFRSWAKGGSAGILEEKEFQRDLQADTSAAGGYMVLPTQLANDIIIARNNLVWVRKLATVDTLVKAASLGIPTLSADPADANWTSELLTGSDDTTMAFGRRDLSPWPLAKLIKISNKLLRVSSQPVEQLVRDRFAYKYAVTEEKAYLVGTGSGQPLGVFTASANGVTTTQDISTGNTTTAVTFDGLINAKMNLREPYRKSKSCRWLFNRTVIATIMTLKDGMGRYIWQPSQQLSEPDILLGIGVAESEYSPNTMTTGLYVGIIGDWSMYRIAEALDMQMQRLLELYAATNQTGFITRIELDAMPVLAEAFARVKLA